MATGRPTWYLDACIFLAWLKDEARPPGEMEGIEEMVRSADRGDALILTSVLTRIEVLESTLTEQARQKFNDVLLRRSVQSAACDMRVAEMAHAIRDFYQSRDLKLHTPDAIHLATAIIYQVDTFFTFDGSGRTSGRKVKLVPLSGDVAGHNLRIEVPMGEPDLFSGLGPPGGSPPKKP